MSQPMRQYRLGYAIVTIAVLTNACQMAVQNQPDIPHGGRVRAVAVHSDAQHMLAASETGGLFRSIDAGSNWKHLDGLPSYMVIGVAYAPTDPNVALAITASGYAKPSSGGIWRSTDKGTTWLKVASGSAPASPRCRVRSNAYAISFEPGSPRAYVATDCGLAVTEDVGLSWTFTILDPARPTNADSTPDATWSVLAGPGGRANVSARSGVWWRPNAVAAWQRAPGIAGRNQVQHAFAASPFNPAHLFFADATRSVYASTDGGQSWSIVPAPTWSNRPQWVRAGVRTGLGVNKFELYWGNGKNLYRQLFTHAAAGPSGSGTWDGLILDHLDAADIAFAADGSGPVLLATDGGVHRTDNGGRTWKMTGNGEHGFNALQITELVGQDVSGSSAHSDQYFATQDNSIWASANGGETWTKSRGGEGFYLRVLPKSVNHDASQLTGVSCGDCYNFKATEHLASIASFPNAPDGDDDDDDYTIAPWLIAKNRYLQWTVNDDATPVTHQFRRTENNGAAWTAAFTIPEEIRGRPIIVGPTSNPTIWQPIRKPGFTSNGFDRIELVRITNLYGPGAPVINYVDLPGTGALGVFATMFSWYQVFGANPFAPDRLLVPDMESGTVLSSTDAGTTWTTEAALTDKVTAAGTRYFAVDNLVFLDQAFPNVHMIEWDPSNGCHVVVGLAEGGVLRSVDAGVTWNTVDASPEIWNLSSFYFPASGDVGVSSYGRGLWKLQVKRSATCVRLPPDIRHLDPARWIEFREIPRVPFDPRNPGCPRCTYIAVRFGKIVGIRRDNGKLSAVRVTGGVVQQLNAGWREVPLEIPNEIYHGAPDFEGHNGLQELVRAGESIRALAIEGDSIRGAVVSEKELETPLQNVPYVRALSRDMRTGMPAIRGGDTITIIGEGFTPMSAGGGAIELRVASELRADSISVDPRGTFRVRFAIDLDPGQYSVEVQQQAGKRLVRDRTRFLVVTRDGIEARP